MTLTTKKKILGALVAVAALGAGATTGASASGGHDPWECAANGQKPGWCQTYSVDRVELVAADGSVLAGQDCRTGRAPDPSDRFTGLCADWGVQADGSVPILDDGRAAGATAVRRHLVNPGSGDRSLTWTVPEAGAAATTVRMTGVGGVHSPDYDITTTMTLTGAEPGVTAKKIPYYSKAQRTAKAAQHRRGR